MIKKENKSITITLNPMAQQMMDELVKMTGCSKTFIYLCALEMYYDKLLIEYNELIGRRKHI